MTVEYLSKIRYHSLTDKTQVVDSQVVEQSLREKKPSHDHSDSVQILYAWGSVADLECRVEQVSYDEGEKEA